MAILNMNEYDIDNLPSITREEAQKLGVNIDSIAICKKIRQLAKLDRLTIRTDEHSTGYARNLIEYIEYCGLDITDYIKDYLSNLQPYMIERIQAQEPRKTFRCVVDNMYAVSLYIKLDTKEFEEVVVSFHESYGKGGVAKKNNLINRQTNRLVPIFADRIGAVNTQTGEFSAKYFIQRGLLTLPLSSMAIKCEDFFLVREQDITPEILRYCNRYIEDLYSSDLDLDFSQIEIFSMLQQLSFTSYGRDCFSSISLLIDSLTIQHDVYSKKAADFALISFVQNLKLTSEQKEELLDLLQKKYAVTNIKKMPIILQRISDALLCPIPEKSRVLLQENEGQAIEINENEQSSSVLEDQ